jgi:hypothetical protein
MHDEHFSISARALSGACQQFSFRMRKSLLTC